MSEANKAVVRAITERLWNGRDWACIPEFYAEDYVADYRPHGPLRHGHAGIRGMVERAWAAFPDDYHEELRLLVAEGPWVVAHLTITGTQRGPWGPLPPTGRRTEFDEMLLLELRDGKVVRQRGIVDTVAALRGLGIWPAPPADA